MGRFTALALAAVIVPALSLLFSVNSTRSQNPFATNTPDPIALFATNTPQPTNPPAILPTATPATAAQTIGPYDYPDGINPMTGLPYPHEEARARRNLIVKISNYPPIVRPQHGLNQADLVFEYEAEGGVTRFAAIFRSNAPPRIGSIRSARLLDIELATMYSALLAYSGTSEPIQELLLASDFRYRLLSPSIGDNCENAGFCRDETLTEREYEHTLFGDARQMWEIATGREVNVGFRALGFAFNEQPAPGGEPARDITINWYGDTRARWQYDAEGARYLRSTDDLPHLDAADDAQLWTDNLAILEVSHNRRPDLFPPGVDYESLEIALWGQGPALILRDGQVYTGFWRRLNEKSGVALQLIDGSNTSIPLKPGRTWVAITRLLGAAEISTELDAETAP